MSIDLVPLSQLPSRYGIARSNLYNRIKELKIESVKHGRKAFVTEAHLELLDGLHAHLERGGTIFGFIQLLKKQGHQHGDWTCDSFLTKMGLNLYKSGLLAKLVR